MDFLIMLYLILQNAMILLMTFMFLIIFKNNNNNSYFRVGPSHNLTLINFEINTKPKYIASLIGITILRLSYIVIYRIGSSIVSDTINNYNKNNIKKSQTLVISFISSVTTFLYSLTFIILLKIYITQFDYALITIVFSEFIFGFINYFLIRNKKIRNNNNNNILDVSTINPLFDSHLEFH